jgi:outer membrane protein
MFRDKIINVMKNIFVAGMFLVLSTQMYSQQKLMLSDVIKIALEKNYDIQLVKSDAAVSDNTYSLGNAGFLPQVDATASQTKKNYNTQQTNSGVTTESNNAGTTTTLAGISLNWTLFDGFKMFISYSKLRDYKELGEIKLRSQIEETISGVINKYYDLVRQKYIYKVVKEGISISEERVRLMEDKLSVGSASRFDLLNAKVDLNADKSNLLNQELTINSLKIELNLLLARNGNIDFDVDDLIEMKEGLVFEPLKESAFKNNVDIQQAEKSKSLASSDVGLAFGDFLPKVSLSGGFNYEKDIYNTGALSNYQTNGYYYGLNLSWNLFNGFKTLISYQNAFINLDKNKINYEYTKNEVESNLLLAYKSYKMNIEILNLEEENVSTAKENLDLGMEQLRLGSISPIEFREVQKSYIAAESRFSTAKYKAKMSEVELLKQSGMLL